MQAADRILEHLDDPSSLETFYRDDPAAFRHALDQALAVAGDSMVLRVWQARLEYPQRNERPRDRRALWHMVAIGITVGALIRLPAVWLGDEWYYPRFAPLLAIVSLAVYFSLTFSLTPPNRRLLVGGAVLAVIVAVYVSLLPGYTDSVIMALIHLPVLLWAYLGVVFLGESWRDSQARVSFVRFSGELVVLSSLVAMGWFVLSAVTIALFGLVEEDIGQWYAVNVGVFGAAAIPVVATYLYDVVLQRRIAIAEMLARIFAPLFLVMVVSYLVFTLASGKNPFIERSFLITVNGLLLLVLGISAFSLVARDQNRDRDQDRDREATVGLADYVNLALVVLTLLIDAIALSAILFRLASYGFTPNRLAVLGVNLIVFGHLIWICRAYVGLVRHKVPPGTIGHFVGDYLPVYAAWAAIVVFVLPALV